MPLGSLGEVANNSIIQGAMKLGVVAGVSTSTWNPRSGGSSKSVFVGTQDQIVSLAQDVKTNGWEYNIIGGHKWTLEVIFPYDIIVDQTPQDSDPLFIWDLINTPFEKDIMDLTERPFIAALSTKDRDNIDNKIKTNDRASTAWDQSTSIVSQKVDAQVAYNLKRSGVRGKQGVVQTLRRTIIVPNDYSDLQYFLAQADECVMSKDTLLSIYNSNSMTNGNVLNQIPTVIANALPAVAMCTPYYSTVPLPIAGYSVDKNGINTFVGYLQYPPEYRPVSNNKVQIEQHWVFNKWSAGDWGLYDSYPSFPGTDPTSIFGLS